VLRQRAPTPDEIGAFLPHSVELFDAQVRSTRGSVAVIQLGVRRADHAQALGAHAQAEVKVVVGDGQMLGFKAADCFEYGATHDHAGAGHRGDAARVA
jgi:hypothetical protein